MKFAASEALTFGLELEFQIVDRTSGLLAPSGLALRESLEGSENTARFALEATQVTIEFNSSIHRVAMEMQQEVDAKVRLLCEAATARGLTIRGGGTHIAQFWNERVMTPSARAAELEIRFGFLPKRFSTYGMHVHVGMPDAESAIRVANVLQALCPLFIAMSAASPFLQNTDSRFAASRPLEPLVYPSGGPMPFMAGWGQFEIIAQEFFDTGLARSLKDIYWDVRPKPEFGTVEVRVFDTPLSTRKAVQLAAWTRSLAAAALRGALELPASAADSTTTTAARVSRFMACRDGMAARLFNPFSATWTDAWRWMEELEATLLGRRDVPADASHIELLCARIRQREDHAWMRERWSLASTGSKPRAVTTAALVRYSEQLSDALLA